MHLLPLDWAIVGLFVAGLAAVAVVTRRYSHSVSDFLAGNRCAGRYLLTMSEGVSGLGLVGIVANFEQFYRAGFAASWWSNMLAPTAMILALSGWVVYRFRETRALTMAQFFEMRYSRRFRVFAGIVAWVSGVLNYGVFPAIVAHFLIGFCGWPASFPLLGLHVATFPAVMAVMLGAAVSLALSGGMITVMITDFLQAQFINLVFLAIMAVLLAKFRWTEIVGTLQAAPRGQSLLNPFDQAGVSDFNVWFFAILAFKLFYNCLGWQGTQGYNASARSPHEAKMARVLAEWRNGVSALTILLMPICAYVLLHGHRFAPEAGAARAALAAVADPQLREQMTVPVAVSWMLPAGLAGLFLAAMVGAAVGNDITYLHSWGSIFVQDVLLPFRRTPLSLRQHLFWLRLSIAGVAAFAFLFSLTFSLHDYIYMYFLVTGAIYLGGSGAVIIGGLYWRRGTTAGAWAALIAGGALAAGGAFLRAAWPHIPALGKIAPAFPVDGAWMTLIASLSAIAVYAAASLLTCRRDFDMDRLLHRGPHALPGEHAAPTGPRLAAWKRRLGITPECTRGDRVIYYVKVGWTLFWFAAFLIGTTAGLLGHPSSQAWSRWWLLTTAISACVGAGTIVWFLWGGTRDLRRMLRALREERIDARDDGTVAAAPAERDRAAV